MAEAAARHDKARRFTKGGSGDTYRALYRSPVMDRIGLITRGVQAVDAKSWLDVPAIGTVHLLRALDLPVATFNKKVKANAKLSTAESERVLGFARLVGQVEAMVDEGGDPSGFDARSWLAKWLTEPLPALGNARPIALMNTVEGQNLVAQTLAQIASGAYA